MKKIIFCGGNGAGKSTLGKFFAELTGYKFLDTEDYYFPNRKSGEYYTDPLREEEFIPKLYFDLTENEDVVLASVRPDYGEKIESVFTHAVHIKVPKSERMARIRARSYGKFGDRMRFGGDLYEAEEAFFKMANDRPDDYVEVWLSKLDIPILEIDGRAPLSENAERIKHFIEK